MRVLGLLLAVGLLVSTTSFAGDESTSVFPEQLTCDDNWCECVGVCSACCPEGYVPYCDPEGEACGCVPVAEPDGDFVAMSIAEEAQSAIADASEKCSVSCGDGYYACCNRGGIFTNATCKCHASGSSHDCSSGGPGADACSVGMVASP